MTFETLRAPIALAACLACTVTWAQVKPDGEWRGVGGAAFASSAGNTRATSAQLNLDVVRARDFDKINFGATASYARSQNAADVSETTANKWSAFGQYDHDLTRQVFSFVRLGLESDRLTDLSLRTAVAGGLGYKFADSPELSVRVFTGLGYTTDHYSNLQTIDGVTDDTFARPSLLMGEESSHQWTPTVTFKQRLEVSPSFAGDRAVLGKFTAALGVAMNSTLSLNVGLTDNYNSRPPDGRTRNDVGVFTGINVKFGAQ